jgi:hemerythrin superfamily protein
MTYEIETLKQLRISLDEEDEETSIIPVLENHHKYLKEYISILMSNDTSVKDKQATVTLFFTILNMHARAEEDVFYDSLKHATNKDVRMEGLRGQDEHEIVYELVNELKIMGAENAWSEEIVSKISVLAGILKNHMKEEEQVMFPMVEKMLPETKLIDLTDEYLDKCRIYLDMEDMPSEVSRNDVITFFY